MCHLRHLSFWTGNWHTGCSCTVERSRQFCTIFLRFSVFELGTSTGWTRRVLGRLNRNWEHGWECDCDELAPVSRVGYTRYQWCVAKNRGAYALEMRHRSRCRAAIEAPKASRGGVSWSKFLGRGCPTSRSSFVVVVRHRLRRSVSHPYGIWDAALRRKLRILAAGNFFYFTTRR